MRGGYIGRVDGINFSDFEKNPAFQITITNALCLIQTCDLRRYNRVKRHIKWTETSEKGGFHRLAGVLAVGFMP